METENNKATSLANLPKTPQEMYEREGKYTPPTPQEPPKKTWEQKQAEKTAEHEKRIQDWKDSAKNDYVQTPVNYPKSEMPSTRAEDTENVVDKINFTQKGAEQGDTARQAIENAKLPKYKRITLKDILNDPQFEGKRDSLIANAIGTALGSGLARTGGTDLGVKSALQENNDTQAQNYAEMQAEKDKRALEAGVAPIETLNAQQVAMEATLADTVANAYIERYKATEDAETKRVVLEQMLEDSDRIFNELIEKGEAGDEQIINLATLMGLYSGDFSLTSRLIQKYAPQLIDVVERAVKKLTGQDTGDEDPEKKNDLPQWVIDGNYNTDGKGNLVTFGGNTATPEEIKDDKKYRIFNAGMGKSVVLKEGEAYGYKKEDELLNQLMDSPNLTDDDVIDLYKFGVNRPLSVEDISKAKEAVAARRREQRLQEKGEAAAAQAESDFVKSVQAIRDNTNLTPQQKLDKLKALDSSVTTNETYLKLYDTQIKEAEKGIAQEKLNAEVKDAQKKLGNITFDYGDLDGSLEKIKAFEDTNAALLSQSPELRSDVAALKQKMKTKNILQPAEDVINKTVTTVLSGKDAAMPFRITDEGDLKQAGFAAVNPETYDTNYSNKVAKALCTSLINDSNNTLNIPEQLMNSLNQDGNKSIYEVKYYVKQSPAFKAAKKLLNSKYYKNAKNQKEDYKKLKAAVDFYENKK